jgi:amidase
MTRTVADAAMMLGVLAGVDGYDPRQPTVIEPVDYTAALSEPAAGLRIGIVREGFGTPISEAGVDDAVRSALEALRSAGLTAEEVSIPWHIDAMAVWSVIGTEGGAYQMIDGNGYGMGTKGLYDPELIAHYAAGRIRRGSALSKTVQLVGLTGGYTFGLAGGKHYAMARNLSYELSAAYDAALSSYDVLVMPTVPFVARKLPPADVSLADYLDLAMPMIINTAPFDVTGHPACSVPAGLVNGLPTGMMIVGKRFDDATVLRVAHTFEQAVGGFPAPTPATDGAI